MSRFDFGPDAGVPNVDFLIKPEDAQNAIAGVLRRILLALPDLRIGCWSV